MDRLLLLLLLVFTAFMLITLVLNKMFKNRLFKYIPGLISFIVGLYYIYLSQTANQGLADIGYALIAIMLFTGSTGSLITGLYLDMARKRSGK